MPTILFGNSNAVFQVAGAELTWIVSWGLQRDEWFNFQLSPGESDFPDDVRVSSSLEIVRHGLTTSGVPPWEISAWFVVKNESPPGSELGFEFCGIRGHS
jgi:hypothetical protein